MAFAHFAVIIILILILVPIVYMIVYYATANRRLAESKEGNAAKHKPMMSPLKFLLCYIAGLFLIYLGISLICFGMFSAVKSSGSSTASNSSSYASFDVFTGDQIDSSIVSEFSPEEEIAGYQRRETEDGDFRFVVYQRDKGASVDFPDILVYAEYTGELTDCTFGFSAGYDAANRGYATAMGGITRNGMWFDFDYSHINDTCFVIVYTAFEQTDASGAFDYDDIQANAEASGRLLLTITEE